MADGSPVSGVHVQEEAQEGTVGSGRARAWLYGELRGLAYLVNGAGRREVESRASKP